MRLVMMFPIWLRRKVIRAAVEEVLKGNIVAGIKDVDNRTRVMQWEFVRQLPEPPATITLGSSRSFYIRSKHVSGSYFNHSIGAATLQDVSAILMMYQLRHKRLPKRIILGLDPWMFNRNNGIFRWKYIYSFHALMLKQMDIYPAGLPDRILNELNTWIIRDETTSSLFYYSSKNPISFNVVSNTDVDDWLILPDGSVHYPFYYRYTPQDRAQNKAQLDPKRRVFGLCDFQQISYTNLFENLLRYMKEQGAQVDLFLHPYHPDTYRAFMDHPNYNIIESLEQYIQRTAQDSGLRVIGSFDGGRLGFVPEQFFDKMHGLEEVTDSLMALKPNLDGMRT